MTDEDIEYEIENLLNEHAIETKERLYSDYVFDGGMEQTKTERNKFIFKNENRWKDSFSLLELIIDCCIKWGNQFYVEFKPQTNTDNECLFDTIMRLNGRGCLIANEIYTLLVNGYPDGALANWRRLHEIAVTAIFIRKHGNACARQFTHHIYSHAVKGMKVHQKFEDRLQEKGWDETTIKEHEDKLTEIITENNYDSKKFKQDYGWAQNFIKNLTFTGIEEDIKLDHMRPYFKWASQGIHVNGLSVTKSLGNNDALDSVLVGRSMNNFENPIHQTGISLTQLAICYLTLYSEDESIDTIEYTKYSVVLSNLLNDLEKSLKY